MIGNKVIKKLLKNGQAIGDKLFGIDKFCAEKTFDEFSGYLNELDSKIFENFCKLLEEEKKDTELNLEINTISGYGNPFSPIILVGNELAFDMKGTTQKYNIPVYFFTHTIDFWWKSLISNDKENIEKLHRLFKDKWQGPHQDVNQKNDKKIKKNKVFYDQLKEKLKEDPCLLENFPFCIYDSVYYPKREGRHYWYATEELIYYIIYENPRDLFRELKSLHGEFNNEHLSNYYKLWCFSTECNLMPSTTTGNKIKVNSFLSYLLNKFEQPRILVGGSNLNKLLEKGEFKEWNCNEISKESREKILLYWHNNKKHIIIIANNLSGSTAPIKYIFRLSLLIKEAGVIVANRLTSRYL